MKAAVLDKFGPSTVMEVCDVPKPAINADQVLVEVIAAGVNPIDWKIREGWMSERFGSDFPMILGFDASGIVAEVGANVDGFQPGDHVFARSNVGAGGCYAEYAAINADTVAAKPDQLNDDEAAAMPLAALTALNGLREVGRLQPEQRVLINGAVGGVGVYAIQIAKNMGAHVTGVCSTHNLPLARELGADQVIDYKAQNPLATGETWDVIYDTVGYLKHSEARECLTPDGVYITLVPVEGIEFFIPGQTEIKPRGGYFLVWAPTAADLEILAGWVRQGKLHSVIDSIYPLELIRDAHERSQTERARGKIVLRIKD
ncbi:MAG: NAD(P)-dependent alcohol dehydrogenase [Chromatiales bacterium]|nr:MAG: NAD(P)-dependent alcohol dehydrogenase [Chromatiales bacterium]